MNTFPANLLRYHLTMIVIMVCFVVLVPHPIILIGGIVTITNYLALAVGALIAYGIYCLMNPPSCFAITITDEGIHGPVSRWFRTKPALVPFHKVDLSKSRNSFRHGRFIMLKNGRKMQISSLLLGSGAADEIFAQITAKIGE